ncbi:MAG TPA: hypothetical protein VG734_09240 [Lacunisphaera sp.]|nr:hypothetical protein [Lacunisphaera sp.]
MKRKSQGKLLLHGQGIGDLNDEDVEKRAREIARIRGRPDSQVSDDDRQQALAELQGEMLPETTDTDGESRGAITRDPSEPVSIPGRQAANYEGDDDNEAVERLATEGVEEAQHDQMLASRAREHRQDRR